MYYVHLFPLKTEFFFVSFASPSVGFGRILMRCLNLPCKGRYLSLLQTGAVRITPKQVHV